MNLLLVFFAGLVSGIVLTMGVMTLIASFLIHDEDFEPEIGDEQVLYGGGK